MTGLVRRATLITAVGLLAASAAMAGVPSASTSSQPTPLTVKVVGHGSPPDAAGNITYTIRDAANNPVPGSVVILNFSACGDVRICSSDVGAGLTVNCGAATVSGVTNGAGQITFAVSGSSSGGPPTLVKCVGVTADGVPLSNLNGATADYDGLNGVNLLDVATAYGDVVGGGTRLRSDYDGDADADLLDVATVYGIVVGGGSPLSCATLCP